MHAPARMQQQHQSRWQQDRRGMLPASLSGLPFSAIKGCSISIVSLSILFALFSLSTACLTKALFSSALFLRSIACLTTDFTSFVSPDACAVRSPAGELSTRESFIVILDPIRPRKAHSRFTSAGLMVTPSCALIFFIISSNVMPPANLKVSSKSSRRVFGTLPISAQTMPSPLRAAAVAPVTAPPVAPAIAPTKEPGTAPTPSPAAAPTAPPTLAPPFAPTTANDAASDAIVPMPPNAAPHTLNQWGSSSLR